MTKSLSVLFAYATSVFETATREAVHDWVEIDLAPAFAAWMATDDYCDEYFSSPDDLQLKLEVG
jgi:hypothetical protein